MRSKTENKYGKNSICLLVFPCLFDGGHCGLRKKNHSCFANTDIRVEQGSRRRGARKDAKARRESADCTDYADIRGKQGARKKRTAGLYRIFELIHTHRHYVQKQLLRKHRYWGGATKKEKRILTANRRGNKIGIQLVIHFFLCYNYTII